MSEATDIRDRLEFAAEQMPSERDLFAIASDAVRLAVELHDVRNTLLAERDKLQGVVFAYRLALLADGVPAKVLDEIANGVPQEAKQ